MILILAPGTDEGGVMVVSTKPRYSADAPSLAFKKNFEPSLQGESAGCLSLNTMHPLPWRGEYRVFVIKHSAPFFEAPCMYLCLFCSCVKTVLYSWYVYLSIAEIVGPIYGDTVHRLLHFIHIIVMFTWLAYLKFDIFANTWKYSLRGTMRSCTWQYIEKYVAI